MTSIFIKRQKEDLFRDITSLGSLSFYLIISIIFLLLKNFEFFKKLSIGLALIYIVVIPIRSFYFKHRPDKFKYKTYLDRLDAASFPSLHAARTSFMCLVLIRFFNNSVISLLLIVLAFPILYSRISLKKHDLTDVGGGVVIGGIAFFVINMVF